MDAVLLEKLQKPFEDVRKRQGKGGLSFDYIPIGDVVRRVLTETNGDYRWEIVSLSYQPMRGTLEFMWVCHGRLHLISDDAVFFDGIGTHPATDEESPKAAESDAYKRAAVKCGVALHLYDDPHSQNGAGKPSRQRTEVQGSGGGANAGVWNGPGLCPSCNAPVGAPHSSKCQR